MEHIGKAKGLARSPEQIIYDPSRSNERLDERKAPMLQGGVCHVRRVTRARLYASCIHIALARWRPSLNIEQATSVDVFLGVHADTIGGGLAETTIQLVTVLLSPSASPPPPAAAEVVTEAGSGDDPEFVLADEEVQRGGDTGLNAVILVIAITTSLVVMCCAYYTVRFMRIKVKSVALSKQVRQYSILSHPARALTRASPHS
jgi:hypothetical protein